MAYRCLTQWTTPGGTTYNLFQIDDFTLIPSAVKTATSPYRSIIYDNRSIPPSFFSVAGDIIYKSDQMISTSTVFAESEGMRISTGKIDSSNKGVLIYNKISSSDLWKFGLSNVSSSTYRDYKFAVIIDDTNYRTFFLLYVKTVGLGSSYDGHTVYVFSAMYQGVDLFNETFNPVSRVYSNGGGATHIAKRTGQLSNLSSYTSDILIVSGGGGGGLLVNENDFSGKDAGGISGSGDNSANQTTGYAFGQGESGTNASGGGSGLYGGYKGTSSKSGGAGSGYIGNVLLSNKKMVGYNVPTSSAESTKTESTNEVSEIAMANKPKTGNGYAMIRFVRNANYRCISQISNKNLLQITNFSIIPSSIIEATTFMFTNIYSVDAEKPDYIVSDGDSFYHSSYSTFDLAQVAVIDSTNFSLLCPSGIFQDAWELDVSGLRVYNKNTNQDVLNYGLGRNQYSNGYRDYYIGIVIDDDLRRGYLIILDHTENTSTTDGWRVNVVGGLVNGVDYIYEACHNLT